MTEFAVGASSLSLLLLGSLAIAGYQETDRRNVLAARQAAWQESWITGSASGEVGATSIHAVHFADAGVREPSGSRLQVRTGDVTVLAAYETPEGLAGATTELLLNPLRIASGFLGSGFDLTGRRLVRGQVTSHLEPLETMPSPFDALELDLVAPFALLADGWHAGGPAHVGRRAAGLVPTGRLAAVNSIWRPLSVPAALLEPSLRDLCLGLIEPERIPEDRLGPGRTPLAHGCQ